MSDSYETDCSADAPPLWPTPSACNANDGEGAATWLARRERLRLKGYNGNGAGIPLAIAVQVAEPTPTDATRLWSSPRAYSFDRSHRPGLTPLDIRVRGLYPHNKRYRPGAMDAPDASTWSSVAHLASQLRRLVSAVAGPTSAGSGARHCASLRRCSRAGWYWRTPQESLAFDMGMGSRPLAEYSPSYPRWGTAADGELGALTTSEPRTDASASSSRPTPTVPDDSSPTVPHAGEQLPTVVEQEQGLWPTPQAHETGRTPEKFLAMRAAMEGGERMTITSLPVMVQAQAHDAAPGQAQRVRRYGTEHGGRNLNDEAVQANGQSGGGNVRRWGGNNSTASLVEAVEAGLWPTPRASCQDMDTLERSHLSGQQMKAMKQAGQPYQTKTSGVLNPSWVETLMGFPTRWTDPDCAAPQEWPGWPARPGHPQHAYESPRLARGVKHRVSRLKALGNAVVAAQALPLFQAIMQVERAERDDGDAGG